MILNAYIEEQGIAFQRKCKETGKPLYKKGGDPDMFCGKNYVGIIESDGDLWKHRFVGRRKKNDAGSAIQWSWVHLKATEDELVVNGSLQMVKSWVVNSRQTLGTVDLVRELLKLTGDNQELVEQLLNDATNGL